MESTINPSVSGVGGISIGREPEAMTTLSALTTSTEPSALVSSTCLPASSLPVPSSKVTPLALNRPPTPVVNCLTILSLRASMAGTSISTPLCLMPCLAKLSFASINLCELSRSALDGMQPTFRQVPPSLALPLSSDHFSIQAVLSPSWAARMAQT